MIAAASMSSSTSSLPILSSNTHLPLQKLNRHCYLTLHFTNETKPSNCKSFAVVGASSSSSSFSASSVEKNNNSEPMIPPYNVLITGSTKGIGFALAKEFLKSGDNVIICSRSEERVKSALESLKAETGKQHVWGTKCDVRDGNDVKNLVAFSQEQLKYIDIWKFIFERPPPNVRKIVLATNMAEASITINDIVFVVDCGKAKETTYDALNNTPCLLPSWISQASARQRRGRAGRVQPGECYHLYPRCVYEAFAEYQLPELLRTPLNSLCLQIKSLQVESIGDFISAALQPPEPLAVQNAVDFLKMIGALDENENLTHLGKFLSVLPVDPKLGKMLIMGAIFCCFDPILTIVAGLSVRDPFLLPQDKKDLAGTAKSRFSAKDYSDHMALVRAYEGWKDAEREGSAYEYCWRNFLSLQTLQAIHSLRKQFTYILKDAGLLDTDGAINNRLSHNQSLVRAVICSGLFPGIASVVPRETSMSFKTMDDGPVFLYANSVNARYQTIQYPWLVFGEKVKVNTVFIRDSTGVSDSILILFGGKLESGATGGHLKMLEGYVEFFMDPSLAESYVKLKEEVDNLLKEKLQHPSMDIHKEGKYLMLAVQELVSGDQCEGRFVFGRDSKKTRESGDKDRFSRDGTNPKSLIQTLLMRAGHSPPKYKTKHLKTNEFRALVEFKGMQFVGKPKRNKVLAEKDAAIEALAWLTQTSENNQAEDDKSPPDVTDNMLKLLGRRRQSKRNPR